MRRVRTIGEFLSGYLKRLEGADDQRIRVDSDTSDNKGNVVVRPVLMLGKDTNDDIRPAKMDTEGRLDVVGVVPEHQTEVNLDQLNPVSGTQYETLAPTELVRIISIAARSTWTVQPNPLEVHLTIDGNVITFTRANPNNNVWYTCAVTDPNVDTSQPMQTVAFARERTFLLEGRSVAITGEIIGGTVSRLQVKLKWARW